MIISPVLLVKNSLRDSRRMGTLPETLQLIYVWVLVKLAFPRIFGFAVVLRDALVVVQVSDQPTTIFASVKSDIVISVHNHPGQTSRTIIIRPAIAMANAHRGNKYILSC